MQNTTIYYRNTKPFPTNLIRDLDAVSLAIITENEQVYKLQYCSTEKEATFTDCNRVTCNVSKKLTKEFTSIVKALGKIVTKKAFELHQDIVEPGVLTCEDAVYQIIPPGLIHIAEMRVLNKYAKIAIIGLPHAPPAECLAGFVWLDAETPSHVFIDLGTFLHTNDNIYIACPTKFTNCEWMKQYKHITLFYTDAEREDTYEVIKEQFAGPKCPICNHQMIFNNDIHTPLWMCSNSPIQVYNQPAIPPCPGMVEFEFPNLIKI